MSTRTGRERFLETLAGGGRGDIPRHERFIREEVQSSWREQGLSEQALAELLALDQWQTGGLSGPPAIELRARPPLEHPVSCAADLSDWRRRHSTLDRLADDWPEQAALLADRSWPCGLSVSRGLLQSFGVNDGATLENVLLFLADYRREARRALDDLAEWTVDILGRAVEAVAFDYLICGEPIASQHAPVISPAMFEDLLGGFYRTVTRFAHEAGIPVVIWESYGAVSPLLPAVVAAGFNTLWIGHAAASAVDYPAVRGRYPGVGLIGGIDSRILQRPEWIEAELERVARPLLRTGRYVPMLDDRLRPGISWAAFASYRGRLEALLDQG